jgi:hypothetical protein
VVVVLVVSFRITAVSHIEFTRAQFNYRIVHGQAVYSANDRRKDSMINHDENDLRRPEIKPGSPDSQFNALPIGLTGRPVMYQMYWLWT